MWLIYFSVINSILNLHMFLSSPCIFCIIRTEQYLYLVINIANVILGDKSTMTNLVSFVIAASICLAVVVFEYFRVLIWFVLPQRLWWNVKFRCHFFFRYNIWILKLFYYKSLFNIRECVMTCLLKWVGRCFCPILDNAMV